MKEVDGMSGIKSKERPHPPGADAQSGQEGKRGPRLRLRSRREGGQPSSGGSRDRGKEVGVVVVEGWPWRPRRWSGGSGGGSSEWTRGKSVKQPGGSPA